MREWSYILLQYNPGFFAIPNHNKSRRLSYSGTNFVLVAIEEAGSAAAMILAIHNITLVAFDECGSEPRLAVGLRRHGADRCDFRSWGSDLQTSCAIP